MLVLVTVQIAVAVLTFMYTEGLANAAQTGFAKLWSFITQDDKEIFLAIDDIQRALQCCGNTGPSDWTSIGRKVPPSCCFLNACGSTFSKGCGTQLYDFVSSSGKLIAWITSFFAVFEV